MITAEVFYHAVLHKLLIVCSGFVGQHQIWQLLQCSTRLLRSRVDTGPRYQCHACTRLHKDWGKLLNVIDWSMSNSYSCVVQWQHARPELYISRISSTLFYVVFVLVGFSIILAQAFFSKYLCLSKLVLVIFASNFCHVRLSDTYCTYMYLFKINEKLCSLFIIVYSIQSIKEINPFSERG